MKKKTMLIAGALAFAQSTAAHAAEEAPSRPTITIGGASAEALFDALDLPAHKPGGFRLVKSGAGFECARCGFGEACGSGQFEYVCAFHAPATFDESGGELIFSDDEGVSALAKAVFDGLRGPGKVTSESCGIRFLERRAAGFVAIEQVIAETGEVRYAELRLHLRPGSP